MKFHFFERSRGSYLTPSRCDPRRALGFPWGSITGSWWYVFHFEISKFRVGVGGDGRMAMYVMGLKKNALSLNPLFFNFEPKFEFPFIHLLYATLMDSLSDFLAVLRVLMQKTGVAWNLTLLMLCWWVNRQAPFFVNRACLQEANFFFCSAAFLDFAFHVLAPSWNGYFLINKVRKAHFTFIHFYNYILVKAISSVTEISRNGNSKKSRKKKSIVESRLLVETSRKPLRRVVSC